MICPLHVSRSDLNRLADISRCMGDGPTSCKSTVGYTYMHWRGTANRTRAQRGTSSQSVSFVAVPPAPRSLTVSKDGSTPLGQHKYMY